nr:hypothetical protein [uncultured Thiocystis sp.]
MCRVQRGQRHGNLLPGLRIIEPCEELTGLDPVALIHQHLCKAFLDARAHGRLHPRLQRPGPHDLADDRPARHGVRDDRFGGQLEPVEHQPGDDDQRGGDEEGREGGSLHGRTEFPMG